MPHKLIVGTTMSGKSTLARAMAHDAASRGIMVVVYDPLLSPDWSESALVSDSDVEFFSDLNVALEDGRRVFAVVDEADTFLAQGDRPHWWLFTRGRHFGIEACAITQRPALIAPTVRGQCHEVYCFNINRRDAELLAEDFSAEGLKAAPTLKQGEFLRATWKDKIKIVDRLKIF